MRTPGQLVTRRERSFRSYNDGDLKMHLQAPRRAHWSCLPLREENIRNIRKYTYTQRASSAHFSAVIDFPSVLSASFLLFRSRRLQFGELMISLSLSLSLARHSAKWRKRARVFLFAETIKEAVPKSSLVLGEIKFPGLIVLTDS